MPHKSMAEFLEVEAAWAAYKAAEEAWFQTPTDQDLFKESRDLWDKYDAIRIRFKDAIEV